MRQIEIDIYHLKTWIELLEMAVEDNIGNIHVEEVLQYLQELVDEAEGEE
jgi:hypothetical protein